MGFLDGTKICLREVRREDLSLFKEWRNDAELTKNFRTLGPLTERNQCIYWQTIVNSDKHKVFTIIKEETGIPIGEIRLSYINFIDGNAEIGILLNQVERKKGYASEALNLILDFGFNRLRLQRIEAEYLETNIDSAKLFRKAGFVIEGIKRSSKYFDGWYYNSIIASILKSDYKGKSSLKTRYEVLHNVS